MGEKDICVQNWMPITKNILQEVLSVVISTAASDYLIFNHQSDYYLFDNSKVCLIKCQKIVKNAHHKQSKKLNTVFNTDFPEHQTLVLSKTLQI